MNRIQRIKEMEECLDTSKKAVEALVRAVEEYEKASKSLKKLSDYYGSSFWMDDYEYDEQGKLPDKLKRGVLSEDAVYNILTENRELNERMLKLISDGFNNKVL